MDDRIKASFDAVRAGDALKASTRAYIKARAREQARRKAVPSRPFIAVAACFVLMIMSGNWLYFSPIASISIDVNPSVEWRVNRLGRVISAEGYNEDGERLAERLDVRFQSYEDAVAALMKEESITGLLAKDAVLTITVVSRDEAKADQMLSTLRACTTNQRNTYCYRADWQEVSAAHEAGLSYGKYRAFLEASALDPSLTPNDMQGMTMREIRDLIQALSSGDTQAEASGRGQGQRDHGRGNGRRRNGD